MSLEQQIETLNSNIAKLIAAMSTGNVPGDARTNSDAAAAAAPAKPRGAKAPAKTSAPPTDISIDDLKKKFLALIGSHGRDAGMAVLQRHGVAKLTDLKPDQYASTAAAIARVEAEGLEAA